MIETALAVALTMQLGDPSYEVRMRAYRDLLRLDYAAVPALRSSDEHLAQHVFDEWLATFGRRKTPWIDGLPKDYPGREEILRRYLVEGYYGYDPDWTRYRLAMDAFVRDLALAGVSRVEVNRLLDAAAKAERDYWERRGMIEEYEEIQ